MTENTLAKATFKQWIAVIGSLLGAFMAILDISITNASLQDIQGGLSATLDEGAWISTAYLVAEIIVIPLTGWLSQVFGLRRYLLWSASVFIVASMLCGTSQSLNEMIFFRVIQGFSGGVLIPLSATIILTHLPSSQRPLGLALFSLSATFAPCIGPTIGGWLTVNYSWPYIFYINLVPGLLLLFLVGYGVEKSDMKLDLIRQGDWWGIASMATALGCLTVVLEEGVRKDWFGSDLILYLTIALVAASVLFLLVEVHNPKPFINIRLLLRRNFLLVNLGALAFGFGIYGSIFILPLFLAQIERFDAIQIGEIIMWSGIPQLVIIPVLPLLVKRFDNRVLAGIGFLLFGTSAFMNAGLTKDWGYDQFLWSQIVRAAGQPFIITCMSNLAYAGMEPSEVGSASGLFNMMRNLGGSIGIGVLGAVLNNRYHLHFTRIAEATSRFSLAAQQQVANRTEILGLRSSGEDLHQAMATVFGTMNREAFVMAYSDCFLAIGVMFYVSVVLIAFIQKAKAPVGMVSGH